MGARNTAICAAARILALGIALAAAACGGDEEVPGFLKSYLVASTPDTAPVTDPNLGNAWGIARGDTGPWWVADNLTGLATSYDGTGKPLPPVVTIPPPPGSPPGATGAPAGVAINATGDFIVAQGGTAAPAAAIFATEDGTIAGWSALVDPTAAIIAVDNSGAGASYKGLAIGVSESANFIYAANFSAGTVDVFDGNFAPVTLACPFVDARLPAGYAPFGIQNITGNIFVAYAKQDALKESYVAGKGNGYVDVFDTDGCFVRRFTSQGQLNAPWAMVQTPASFGRFGGAVVIGNAGDGYLNAFDPVGGAFLGQLNVRSGRSIRISGLWGLGFGNGGAAGDAGTMYFAAGPGGGQEGLFGTLEALD